VDAPAKRPNRKPPSESLAGCHRRYDTRGREDPRQAEPRPGKRRADRGIKVVSENGWFAARPSGTENLYKIYAESFLGPDHLRGFSRRHRRWSTACSERTRSAAAQAMVDGVLGTNAWRHGSSDPLGAPEDAARRLNAPD